MGMEDYIFRVVVPEEEKCETTKTGKAEKVAEQPAGTVADESKKAA